MSKLKHLCPELSRLCAQVVHAKYQRLAEKETAELRAIFAEFLRRGRKPEDLIKGLLTGDMGSAAIDPQQITK